ncbi:hypothetical protein GCM10027060_13770 [Nesterenkonia halophila]
MSAWRPTKRVAAERIIVPPRRGVAAAAERRRRGLRAEPEGTGPGDDDAGPAEGVVAGDDVISESENERRRISEEDMRRLRKVGGRTSGD